jgi:hypothetical protein
MKLLRAQTKHFNDLDKGVATSEPTRKALVRWEEKNDELSDRLGAEIEAFVKSLSAEQRAARLCPRFPTRCHWRASRVRGLPVEIVAWRVADGQAPLQDAVQRLVQRIRESTL